MDAAVIRRHLTFANVMSVAAVFIALGGTAVALKANSVGSRQIKNDSIKGRDVGNGKLKGKDLASGAIGAREIQEAAFDLSPFVAMESASDGCDPESDEFVACGSVALATQEPSRALLVAGGGQYGSQPARGTCKFQINGSAELLESAPPSFGDPVGSGDGRLSLEANGLALTAVSDRFAPIPAGSNSFTLLCNETGGDVKFDTTLSVITLGGTPG